MIDDTQLSPHFFADPFKGGFINYVKIEIYFFLTHYFLTYDLIDELSYVKYSLDEPNWWTLPLIQLLTNNKSTSYGSDFWRRIFTLQNLPDIEYAGTWYRWSPAIPTIDLCGVIFKVLSDWTHSTGKALAPLKKSSARHYQVHQHAVNLKCW